MEQVPSCPIVSHQVQHSSHMLSEHYYILVSFEEHSWNQQPSFVFLGFEQFDGLLVKQ